MPGLNAYYVECLGNILSESEPPGNINELIGVRKITETIYVTLGQEV